MKNLILFIFIFFQISLIYCSEPKLEFVMTFFRHGDRSPINVPPKGYNYIWNESNGFLTQRGVQQALELGATLGKLYIKEKEFISSDFEEAINQIYVESSDYSRTLQTANAVLHGMFSDKLKSSYLPIMINSKVKNEDFILNALSNCDIVNNYKSKLLYRSDRMIDLANDNNTITLSKKLSDFFGYNEVSMIQWHEKFYDPIFCAKETNLSLIIKGLTDEEITTTIDIGNKLFEILFTENENYLSQVATTNIFLDFRKRFNNYTEDPTKPKWIIYSGHDTTLLPILGALNINDSLSTIPYYTSNINFEVTRVDDKRYVNIYYNGVLKSPSCLSLISQEKAKLGCPIEQFYDMYCTVERQTWLDNCQNIDSDDEDSCNPFDNSSVLKNEKKIAFAPFYVVFSLLGFIVGFSMFYFVLLRLFRTNKTRKSINNEIEMENSDEEI